MRGFGSLNAWVREPECVDARVREVVDHLARMRAVHRYHFTDYSSPLTYPASSMLRIHSADYQAVPASDPIMCLAGRCQGSPLRSDRCAASP